MQVAAIKTIITFGLAFGAMFCIALQSNAQVKIGGVPGPPVSSAILELDGGGTKALRLPIVNSKEQLGDLPNPVNGLMVYGSHTGSVYYHHQNSWYELKEPLPSFSLPHEGTYNYSNATVLKVTNTANMGRGIHAITNNSYAVLGYSGIGQAISGQTADGTALEGLAIGGTALRARSSTGLAAYFSRALPDGASLVVDTGRVGIGTLAPQAMLDIDAAKFGGVPLLRLNGATPTIQINENSTLKSLIQHTGNNMLIGPVLGWPQERLALQTNGTRRFTLDANGRVGIGANAEQWTGVVNIKTNLVGPALLIDMDEPEIRLRSGNADRSKLRWDTDKLILENNGANDIVLKTNNTDRLLINGSTGTVFMEGRLGVGAPASVSKFLVDGIGHASTETVTVNDEAPLLQFRAAGDANGFVQLSGSDMRIGTNAGVANARLVMRTGGSDRFYMNANGNASFLNTLSVGTPEVATGYALSVRGRIMGEEIRIQNFAAWPDYVFKQNYPLRSLQQVAAHIAEKGHLPGIPPAAEVEKNGFDVGQMEAKLLEKVEELTLYLIEANRRIEQLEQTIKSSKKQ
ncbi:MAG: hypothetical protein MUF24_01320 [Chitinophagaceae bacterium]|jgi:hypothetical protein|nr:hypothetical protein [Chitinophagaceae bacterium]